MACHRVGNVMSDHHWTDPWPPIVKWPPLSEHEKARIRNSVVLHDQLDSLLLEHGGKLVILPGYLLGIALSAAAILGALGVLGIQRLLSP